MWLRIHSGIINTDHIEHVWICQKDKGGDGPFSVDLQMSSGFTIRSTEVYTMEEVLNILNGLSKILHADELVQTNSGEWQRHWCKDTVPYLYNVNIDEPPDYANFELSGDAKNHLNTAIEHISKTMNG